MFIHSFIQGGGEIAQLLASLSTKWAIQVRARLDCYRKVELYHCVIDSLPPVPPTG